MLRTALGALILVLAPTTLLSAESERPHAPDTRAFSAFSDDPARQFDFWIGTWQVHLAAQQEDLSWQTLDHARASIYPILGGRAILELWDAQRIKGYSLRYWDTAAQEWVLWLNWPGNNRSNANRMGGRFTHGRGEFFGAFQDGDGNRVQSVFTFSDITPFSLRWDDRYSADGGRSWSYNWRMEFLRDAVDPAWPIPLDTVPTWHDGSRCDLPGFVALDTLHGDFAGRYQRGEQSGPARMRGRHVLDGCGLVAFVDLDEDGEDDWFVFRTWDTTQHRFEDNWLSAEQGSRLQRFFGGGFDLLLGEIPGQRVSWSRAGGGVTVHLEPGGDALRLELAPR